MTLASATLRGAKKLKRDLKADTLKQKKSLQTAIKVEGFNLKKMLQKDIRSGAPGGRRFKKLTFIGRRGKGGSSRILNRLALGVRYQVANDPFSFRVGWVGPRVSKSWKRLAKMHQEGFERDVTPEQRVFFRSMGEGLEWKKAEGRSGTRLHKGAAAMRKAKFFYIRKTTTKFRTPARPIMDPFWAANHNRAWRNIRNNFRRKLAGKRI